MTKEKELFFFIILSTNKTMSSQQSVYIFGMVNLFLAGIAVLCVVQAEEHPEYFSLVYIAVSIFLFYMGTILIIITLQIIETCQEQQQQQQNQSSLEIQIPILTTQISSRLNAVIDESLTIPTKPKLSLSRSQTLPLTLSSYNPHPTPSVLALPSTLKDFKNRSTGLLTTSTHLTLLPKYQQTFATIHKNYQSFSFVTNDLRYPS
jgi:hypothetical protein